MNDFSIKINQDRKTFEVHFTASQLCSAVGRLEFCSRLLYNLRPNDEAVWHQSQKPRVNAHIIGFPKHIMWARPTELILKGSSDQKIEDAYFKELELAIKSIKGKKLNEFNVTEFSFSIIDNSTNKTYNYTFDSRSRAIVAFCVLWDGDNHPRDHLEVWRSPSVPFLAEFPIDSSAGDSIKTYGDPSKTIDELRNQGFPRNTDQSPRGMSLDITRANKYNTIQEHYKLVKREQSQADRVGRSQIPNKYKTLLYKDSKYQCNNCGETFPAEYLAPDHRVPSIVQSDNLSAENFKTVLQTLCVRCNQVKRESCKKCPYGHNCSLCAWAYPEKFGVSKNNLKLLEKLAKDKSITVNELIQSAFEKK